MIGRSATVRAAAGFVFFAFGGSTGWAFSAGGRQGEGVGSWKRAVFTFYDRIEGEGPILTF